MNFIKTVFDYSLALIMALCLWPLFIILGFLIKIDDRGPVFYIQQRVGKNRALFNLIKFRTMVIDAENQGSGIYCQANDPRITRMGNFMRRYSLDELPQLFNILKGEMSFVGPRPTLAYQVEKYNMKQLRRLDVKPGITGWAQVNGRNSIPWSARIELDIWYIDHYSLMLDIKILWKTVFGQNQKTIYGDQDIFDL